MRRLLRTVPLTWWIAAILLAAATGAVTTRSLRAADAAVERWGTTAQVFVVTRVIASGDALSIHDVAVRAVPEAMVPHEPVAEDPVGRVALVDLVPGEVLLERRLAGPGRAGPGALLRPGEQAIAVTALAGERPPVVPGDRVDLIGVPADGRGAAVLARSSRVIDVEEETGAVSVAVQAAAAVRIAEALERGRVVLTLVG